MFTQAEVPALVKLFYDRQVPLFHSAQLDDFQSYVKLGGIPSRSLLERNQLPFTKFRSDDDDRINGVWDKVFLNLVDFSRIFQNNSDGVPNVYGPITFQFSPDVLYEADDIAICLRSAGTPEFSREKECLKQISDVDNLFQYPIGMIEAHEIKTRAALRNCFHTDYVSNPEMSLSVNGNLLSFRKLQIVWVEPYIIEGKELISYVEEWSTSIGFHPKFIKRRFSFQQTNKLNEIGRILAVEVPTLHQLQNNPHISTDLREWVNRLLAKSNMSDQWIRFAEYTAKGTIRKLLATKNNN